MVGMKENVSARNIVRGWVNKGAYKLGMVADKNRVTRNIYNAGAEIASVAGKAILGKDYKYGMTRLRASFMAPVEEYRTYVVAQMRYQSALKILQGMANFLGKFSLIDDKYGPFRITNISKHSKIPMIPITIRSFNFVSPAISDIPTVFSPEKCFHNFCELIRFNKEKMH